MTPEDALARRRYLTMTVARIAGAGGAVFGIVILARAVEWPEKLIGGGLTLAALWMMAVVPRALARRWRSGG